MLAGKNARNFEALSSGELLITRDGVSRRIGHRDLRRYYKQNYSLPDQRVSVLAAQREHLLMLYKNAGIETSEVVMHSEGALTKRGMLIQRAVASKEERRLQHQMAYFASATKGNSKGFAAQYVFKEDHADNAQNRAIVHHWGAGGGGSHYNMAAAKSAQKGKEKGLSSRHSKQGQRLQAKRNQQRAQDVAKGQMGVRNNAQKGPGPGPKKKGGHKGKASGGE